MTEKCNENTGLVTWFDARKGIGFITKDDGTGDIFCHWTNIEMEGFKTLKPGQVVSFELGQNHRGVQAVKIKVLRDAEKEEK
jgi:CspA family cold shock protein